MSFIYIVEDDVNIREIERYALKNSGFSVKEFACGKEFFQAAEKKVPNLVVLDIMLPGEDGLVTERHMVKAENRKKCWISNRMIIRIAIKVN